MSFDYIMVIKQEKNKFVGDFCHLEVPGMVLGDLEGTVSDSTVNGTWKFIMDLDTIQTRYRPFANNGIFKFNLNDDDTKVEGILTDAGVERPFIGSKRQGIST